MKVEVIRGLGQHDGGVIYAPMLSTVQALVERGRTEIENGESVSRVKITTPFFQSLRPGQIVEVKDEIGGLWRGKIIAVRLKVGGVDSSALIEVIKHEG